MKTGRFAALAMLWFLAIGITAQAYINPNFTPKDLANDSELILLLEFKSIGEDGKAVAVVKQVLKGQCEDKEVTFDLLAMPEMMQMQGKEVMGMISNGNRQALLFSGRFMAEGTGVERAGDAVSGLLHVGAKWANLALGDNNVWELERINEQLLGTFSGGTDMLLRCVKYVMSDPSAEVPVDEKVDWGSAVSIGKTDHKVNAVAAVDLAGDGKLTAMVASAGGDQLYRWNGKTMENVTAKAALQSKSEVFAWADFNRDGRLDLASWDGRELSVHQQKADGTFAAVRVDTGDALKNGCLSLAAIDAGEDGKPGLLAGTKASPVLVTFKAESAAEGKPLVAGDFPGKKLGEAGRCLVADFDGDALPDVVQLFSEGGLFYKGQSLGTFAVPVENRVGFGSSRYGACLGDYDHDGQIDILVVSLEGVPSLYQNLGGGKFENMLNASGSFGYITKSGGVCCQTIDINNDGRQDIFVGYGHSLAPQIFFNRGFRCFGLCRKMDSQAQGFIPHAAEGQQAGYAADFTGISAPSLFLVLNNGELWMVSLKMESPALAAVAVLSTKSPRVGPANVQAWDQNQRSFGAWPVTAGDPGATFGMTEMGPLMLKWRLPGGKPQEKEVIVEGQAVRAVLE